MPLCNICIYCLNIFKIINSIQLMSFEHSPYQYQMHSNRNATKGMHLNTIPGILDILNAFHHLINSIICLSFFFYIHVSPSVRRRLFCPRLRICTSSSGLTCNVCLVFSFLFVSSLRHRKLLLG